MFDSTYFIALIIKTYTMLKKVEKMTFETRKKKRVQCTKSSAKKAKKID